MIRKYEKLVFNGTIVTGAGAISVGPIDSTVADTFAVFVLYTPANPSNRLTVGVKWQGQLAPSMPPSAFPSETIAASAVLQLCPPGPTEEMTLLLSSTGTGTDTVEVWVSAGVSS